MKTRYKYIHFTKITDKPKTSEWACRNNKSGAVLGHVRWQIGWRQYIYEPITEAIYSAGCLLDIADFIKTLKAEKEKIKEGTDGEA